MYLTQYQSERYIYVVAPEFELKQLPTPNWSMNLQDGQFLVELIRNIENIVILRLCGLYVPFV